MYYVLWEVAQEYLVVPYMYCVIEKNINCIYIRIQKIFVTHENVTMQFYNVSQCACSKKPR